MAKLTIAEILALDCDLSDMDWKQAVLTLLGAQAVVPFSAVHTDAVVAVAVTSTTVLAAYATRKGALLTNVSDTAITIKLGTPAVLNASRVVAAGASYEIPAGYTGVITGIHGGSGTKNLAVVEW